MKKHRRIKMKNLIFLGLLISNFTFARAGYATSSSTSSKVQIPNPRNFQFTYKNEITSNLERSRITEGGATSENQIKATYLLKNNIRLGLLTSAKIDIAGREETQSSKEWRYGDLAGVVETISEGILGADNLFFEGRMYFPTSQQSQKSNQELLLRGDINMPYTINGGLGANWYFKPRYFVFEGSHDRFELFSQGKLQAKVNSVFMPYMAVNHNIVIQESSLAYKRAIETLGPELGTDLVVTPIVKLNLALFQDRIIDQPTQAKVHRQFVLFDPKETTYMLKVQIKY